MYQSLKKKTTASGYRIEEEGQQIPVLKTGSPKEGTSIFFADFELEGTIYGSFAPEVVASESLEETWGIDECCLALLISTGGGTRLGGDPAESGADTRKKESPDWDCICRKSQINCHKIHNICNHA